ncbi:MAG: hypothetical protein IPJ74_25070 [Saprospiraceae bacterium]|nr:hypothetical protein [Saprospiraceae bacterium]
MNENFRQEVGQQSPEAAIGQHILRGRSDTLEVRWCGKDFHHQVCKAL